MRDDQNTDRRRPRTVLALLVLASFTVITLDARPGEHSPVDPLRAATGEVFGPLENGARTLASPLTAIPRYFGDVSDLRRQNTELRKENTRLRAELRTSAVARNRADQLDRLLGIAENQGHEIVPAQVTAIGTAQTFSRTVTIDAGRRDGIEPDMTVVAGDGLVGRVIETTRSTATVLLIVDPESTVGGRLARTMELGFVTGSGELGDDGRLAFELVDEVVAPRTGDTVVTWGSRGGAPYVAGVPVGEVSDVRSSPRELSTTVLLRPYVDFSSLDLVGVVVGKGTGHSRDAVARADGNGSP